MELTGDGHVHSEWSWDTGPIGEPAGTMEAICTRAVHIGLPALAFTEHLDLTGWIIGAEDVTDDVGAHHGENALLTPAPFDVDGYLDALDRCRHAFPELTILSGVELGQPHLDEEAARAVVDLDDLDRINGSLHTLARTDEPGAHRSEPITLYRLWPAEKVIRGYCAEAIEMARSDATFDVFTHIDYAVRTWPMQAEGPFDPRGFEEEFRAAMRAIASSGRVLELNVGALIRPWIAQWWCDEGGRAVTFASDAHGPGPLAQNLPEAMALAESLGFTPGRSPYEPWTVSRP